LKRDAELAGLPIHELAAIGRGDLASIHRSEGELR
jgi:hypothetical protein